MRGEERSGRSGEGEAAWRLVVRGGERVYSAEFTYLAAALKI